MDLFYAATTITVGMQDSILACAMSKWEKAEKYCVAHFCTI
jgi:hypothetical protein